MNQGRLRVLCIILCGGLIGGVAPPAQLSASPQHWQLLVDLGDSGKPWLLISYDWTAKDPPTGRQLFTKTIDGKLYNGVSVGTERHPGQFTFLERRISRSRGDFYLTSTVVVSLAKDRMESVYDLTPRRELALPVVLQPGHYHFQVTQVPVAARPTTNPTTPVVLTVNRKAGKSGDIECQILAPAEFTSVILSDRDSKTHGIDASLFKSGGIRTWTVDVGSPATQPIRSPDTARGDYSGEASLTFRAQFKAPNELEMRLDSRLRAEVAIKGGGSLEDVSTHAIFISPHVFPPGKYRLLGR